MILTISNGNVFDVEAGEHIGERTIVVEDDHIVDVTTAPAPSTADIAIDARGAFVLPGMIDAHVHLSITTMNFVKLFALGPVQHSLQMARAAEETVRRGFTTVRDTGGDVHDLRRAIRSGLCEGPTITPAGRVISQTGGHGDVRPSAIDAPVCGCEMASFGIGVVADGVDAVRKAVRFEIRQGARFIKIMTSGGVASPTDPFDCTQYTPEEVRAATVEADHRHTYVTSHAYQPDAIRLAVDNGVRCIEHANMIDAATARHMADVGAVLVPTLVTYKAMQEIGAKHGLPERNLAKNRGVFEAGQRSIEVAKKAGVELGFGTDLLGESQFMENQELAIRAELEPAIDVLRSIYVTNPKLSALEGEVGRISPGFRADLLVSDVDPLERLGELAEPDAHLPLVVNSGRVVKNHLD